ncbi:MAG TPA: DUF4351 domain-containing protein [Clostridiaceae bacterium]
MIPCKWWVQFLKYENKELLERYAMAEPAIKKAINVLDYLNKDVDTKELYEIREKALKDEISIINGAKAEGKAEMLIKLLTKKFTELPLHYDEKIMKLPEETIEVIATDIFDLNDIREVEKYFK